MSKNLYVLIENDDYLKNSPLKEADITKLSFCRHDKTLSMHIHVQELLTFDLYKYFIEYTENLLNDSHFDLDIEVEQHNINQIELNKYFSYFYEHYGLNTIFKEGTINMSILFWRLYTFYLPILVGLFFLIPTRSDREEKTEDTVKNK